MSWRLRYHLDWPVLDEPRITGAATTVAGELDAMLQVEPGGDDSVDGRTVEVFFTVPVERLRVLEDAEFDAAMADESLGLAPALTVTAVFWERPEELKRDGRVNCSFSVSSEEGSNDLCERTAATIAKRLAAVLDAWPAGEGHTKRRLPSS